MKSGLRMVLLVLVGFALTINQVHAQEGGPSPSPTSESAPSATPGPAMSVTALATEDIPPTPGPPTPTAALPEEGGPPGGVLSGHLFIDTDKSGTRSADDAPASGESIRIY